MESWVASAWNVFTAVAGVRKHFEGVCKNSVDREIAWGIAGKNNVETRRGVDVDELRSLVPRRSSLQGKNCLDLERWPQRENLILHRQCVCVGGGVGVTKVYSKSTWSK